MHFVRDVTMRSDKTRVLEVAGKRVALAHEGDDAGLLFSQALRHPARMRRVLGLHRDILTKPAAALAGETHDDEIRTHGRLPACFYVRHHDSLSRTQQEQKRLGEVIRRAVKRLVVAAILGTITGAAHAGDDDLCGGRLHEIDGKKAIFASAAEATCPWGFTVDKVVITCETRDGYDQLYALTATTEGGQSYALNGIAGQWLKLESIRPIWKDREDVPGAKVDLTPWMKAGESICDF
jgi:hypothetical protein